MTQERISRKDLENLLGSLKIAAQRAGIGEAKDWRVDIGSKTYGRAYRLWLSKDDNTGAHYSPVVRDYLGMTAREAFDTMNTLRDAFWAVVSVRDES